MLVHFRYSIAVFLCLAFSFALTSSAQQIYVESPMTNVSDSFYENFGVNFGFSLGGGSGSGSRVVGLLPGGNINPLGNIIFSQGGSGSARPTFGGYDPNAAGRFGYSTIGSGGGGYSLGMEFGSGNSRSITNTTPGVMVQNGYGGFIGDGTIRPFVTGVIPVIGSGGDSPPVIDNGVTRAVESGLLNLEDLGADEPVRYARKSEVPANVSSAELPMASVESIKAERESQIIREREQLELLISAANKFEEANEFKEARIKFREAIKICSDITLKRQLRRRLKALAGK